MKRISANSVKFKNIQVLVLDVDGVLTDGRIIVDSAGQEIKHFDVTDGFGLVLFGREGLKTAIITARYSKPVEYRAKDLKISKVYQNAFPKIDAYKKMLEEFDVKDEEVCYVGDDVPDFEVMQRAGVAIAVKNAHPAVKQIAHYVTKKEGGRGAVREVVEIILNAKGIWKKHVTPKVKKKSS